MLTSLFFVLQSCLIQFSPDCSLLAESRVHFVNILSEEELSNFLVKTADDTCSVVKAYHASLSMRQAEFALNPYKKWTFFKTGRNQLESIIKQHPQDVEIRFIRYLTQANIPTFLGYSGELESDKIFIKNQLTSSTISAEFQQKILNLLE